MSNEQKPEVRHVPQPAVPTQIQAVPVAVQAPAIDMTSPAFQTAVAGAVQLALPNRHQ